MLDHIKRRFRRWFAKVWKIRGGGLYAVGWAATFIYLEISTIVGEIVEAEGVIDFFTGQLIEFVFRFFGESIINMAMAFAWPAYVLQWSPPVGLIALVAAFILFPTFVKPYITSWLFPDGEPTEPEDEPERAQQK